MKDDKPNIADFSANYTNQDKTTDESPADPGAIILELKGEKRQYGKDTEPMAEIQKLATRQERLIRKMLDRRLEATHQQKRPHLTVVK